MPNNNNLLEMKAVSQSYGKNVIVHDLNLTLPRGHIGCLLGPSGCGKTSVLRCIAGFEIVQKGSIKIAGRIVAKKSTHIPAEKRNIGMVFQDYALFPHLTAVQNIAFGINKLARDEKQNRTDEMLDLAGLRDSADKYPHELSGGQQQRIALVRALAPKPSLLLLDEPFSNLDIGLRERLCADVRDIIKQEEVTAIMVTHDQSEAFMIADVIGVMQDGTIEQWDSAYNLYHLPNNRFVADFIGDGVFLPGVILDKNRVEIEMGILKGDLETKYPKGTNVGVLLRPDDIILDKKSKIIAQISDKAFRGAQILYTLRLPSGAEILSLVPSHHNHAINDKVGISQACDHIIIFQKDDQKGNGQGQD